MGARTSHPPQSCPQISGDSDFEPQNFLSKLRPDNEKKSAVWFIKIVFAALKKSLEIAPTQYTPVVCQFPPRGALCREISQKLSPKTAIGVLVPGSLSSLAGFLFLNQPLPITAKIRPARPPAIRVSPATQPPPETFGMPPGPPLPLKIPRREGFCLIHSAKRAAKQNANVETRGGGRWLVEVLTSIPGPEDGKTGDDLLGGETCPWL